MVATGVGVTFWSRRLKVRTALTRPGRPSRSGFLVFDATCSWCLEQGGGGHFDVKAPTGWLYSLRDAPRLRTQPAYGTRRCRDACADRDSFGYRDGHGRDAHGRDAIGRRDGVAMARCVVTAIEIDQPVLFLTVSLFVALEPPREARRGAVVWPDYDSYCSVLCALAPTLTRVEVRSWVEDKTSVDAPDRLTSGETSQQRQGVRQFPCKEGVWSVDTPAVWCSSRSTCSSSCLVIRRLFQNASLVRYPMFFVRQARCAWSLSRELNLESLKVLGMDCSPVVYSVVLVGLHSSSEVEKELVNSNVLFSRVSTRGGRPEHRHAGGVVFFAFYVFFELVQRPDKIQDKSKLVRLGVDGQGLAVDLELASIVVDVCCWFWRVPVMNLMALVWTLTLWRFNTMAPRRCPREGVAEQATRQEAGDSSSPQQTQPLPQDAHGGIVPPPPPPPPQTAQGLDWTQFLEGMAQFVAQHRDAPVPQGGIGRVLREFLQFQPPQFLGQPDPDTARAWLDAVERTFRSMECVPEERVLLASYQLQRDSTVVRYRARFVELGRYAPQIMADESLRTQQFVRGLRSELRHALIVARVTDLDVAYQTAAALEADTLRTRVRSAEVQTQVVPTQPRQQHGSVQTTPRTTTSYASTSVGTTAKSGSRRKFRRDGRSHGVRLPFVTSCAAAADQVIAPSVAAAIAVADAEAAQLVEGTVTVFGFTARVLFDTGASHSFVSEEFLDSLGELSTGESVDLAVELPTGDFVLTSYCLEEGLAVDLELASIVVDVCCWFWRVPVMNLTALVWTMTLWRFKRLRMLMSTLVDVKIFSRDANGRILAVNQVLAAMIVSTRRTLVRVATGFGQITTGSCTGRDGLDVSDRQVATGSCMRSPNWVRMGANFVANPLGVLRPESLKVPGMDCSPVVCSVVLVGLHSRDRLVRTDGQNVTLVPIAFRTRQGSGRGQPLRTRPIGPSHSQEIDGHMCAVKILSWRQPIVPLTPVGGNPCAAKFISKDSDEEAMLSRRLQRILAKKKKFQSGRRYFKKNKDFKRPDGKDQKRNEPLYYECRKPGHMKAECPKLKKPEFRKKDNFKKFRKYKKKAMAAAWENNSDSDSESSCSSDEEKANLAFMANTEDKVTSDSSFDSWFFLVSFLHNPSELFPPESMAAPAIADSLGGYSVEFLTPEQQERFTFVKTKLCGHKEVDIEDLKKNGMSSIVEKINQMQWKGVTTYSEVSYPDLVKAFYVCLRTEADGSLVSSVKGTLIKIDPELLRMLFEVNTSGFSGVHTEDAQEKGLGIVGLGFKLREGKLDINQLNAFNRLLHFIVCQILAPRSATFSSCTKADSDLMFWAIQNKEINVAAVIMERMKFARE
ncbi:hypothetical protein Taro_030242 [Colocasia esculenta]|uniref:Putative plant transposon protein domain-containing protein n=1 Tax=Colocasia esculenta TaxID=4460 RepID=A0A843VVM1_COLES|nr:hypothetical protein [Colocasia esculenta]